MRRVPVVDESSSLALFLVEAGAVEAKAVADAGKVEADSVADAVEAGEVEADAMVGGTLLHPNLSPTSATPAAFGASTGSPPSTCL